MRRGVVFMSCHNAIWEQAAALIKLNVNPDKLSHEALAAELTNHLVPARSSSRALSAQCLSCSRPAFNTRSDETDGAIHPSRAQ